MEKAIFPGKIQTVNTNNTAFRLLKFTAFLIKSPFKRLLQPEIIQIAYADSINQTIGE